MTVTMFIVAIHYSRKLKPEHIKILFDRLKEKDSNLFSNYVKQFEKINPKTFEKIKNII
jgi:hypothetical protein